MVQIRRICASQVKVDTKFLLYFQLEVDIFSFGTTTFQFPSHICCIFSAHKNFHRVIVFMLFVLFLVNDWRKMLCGNK